MFVPERPGSLRVPAAERCQRQPGRQQRERTTAPRHHLWSHWVRHTVTHTQVPVPMQKELIPCEKMENQIPNRKKKKKRYTTKLHTDCNTSQLLQIKRLANKLRH